MKVGKNKRKLFLPYPSLPVKMEVYFCAMGRTEKFDNILQSRENGCSDILKRVKEMGMTIQVLTWI